ncbi:L-alanine-DL-glutamate epimerase [Rhizobiales bacterium GAS191]|nr:L-alanine-DL-glutamate epimerase [Rhizobiales bacterium GAS191]
MRVSLHTAELHYGSGLVLHTAASGSVPHLAELYLRLDDGYQIGIGEVRTNISYLNGLDPETVVADAISAARAIDWTREPIDLLNSMPGWAGRWSAPVRMLIDCALHDLAARRAAKPLVTWLGGSTTDGVAAATNQTLFWSSHETLLAQARAYVERGFRDLKVRVGVGDISEDLRRIAALRKRFGDTVKIAADANGQWSEAEALENMRRLAELGLAYVEQPVPPGDWGMIERCAAASPMPIMLDESIASMADVERVRTFEGQVLAHLKLVKLGGIAPVMSAARRLQDAGACFMIGQMNEGAAATAAALHVTCAAHPAFAELYGADGLANDPVTGVSYRDGSVGIPLGQGLGVTFDATSAHLIWEN